MAAGGAFLVAGGFWLVGGRGQGDQPAIPDTAVALRDSSVSTEDPGLGSAGYLVASASEPTDSAVVDTSAPVSVTITRRPAHSLAVGATSALSAESRDGNGKMVGSERISWSSTDTTVLTVDSAGVVQALAPGRAQVVAAAGGHRDSARIVVRSAPRTAVLPQLASLSIASSAPLQVGDTLTLALSGQDESGKPIPGVRATWSSSDPSVASVEQSSGLIRARAPGGTLIIARSGGESAISSVSVAPAPVASVDVSGARPLKVGDTLDLRAAPRDQRGAELSGHAAVWASSNPDVASVDSSGVVVALAAGTADISASVDGKAGKVRVTVLPQPRTSRADLAAEEARRSSPTTPASDPAAERLRLIDEMRRGVDQCYNAVAQKDVSELEELYHPESKTDQDNLKKLSRILRTSEWGAQVGEREDGAQRIGSATASMEFGLRLSWKDAFGGRLTSHPVFRVEFVKDGTTLDLSSCRIIGTPDL